MTNQKTTKHNAGGRPLSYDPNLVHDIISAGLGAGIPAAELDAPFVKEKLCDEHGVKGSIRHETLEALVDGAHAEIREAENQALLSALPIGISGEVNSAVAAVERELLLVVARQHAASQAISEQKCEELRADKRNAQHRIAELEGELAAKSEEYRLLLQDRTKIAGELLEAQNELRVSKAEIEKLAQGPSDMERIFSGLRDPAMQDQIRAVLTDVLQNAPRPSAE